MGRREKEGGGGIKNLSFSDSKRGERGGGAK